MKRLWRVSRIALFWLLAPPLAYAQAPDFSIQTALSGLMGSTFVGFVSLLNSGTSRADNVVVTSVTLGTAALISPVLPLSVGRLSPGDHNVLDLRFDGTVLIVGNVYLLTVQGTYQVGTQTFSFMVSQPLTITVSGGSELQRWVALDDVKAQFASLPGLDPVADAQAMLTFLRSRTEFVDSGIFADSSSIWARFADGQPVIISQDRDIPLPSTSGVSQTANGASSTPRSQTPAGIFVASTPSAAASASEFPASSSARVLNTLGPGYGGADLVSDIKSWLNSSNYTPVASADASVDSLKTVGGDGVFYISSHGGFEGQGTPGDPAIYAVWTSTIADPLNDVLYNDDLTVSPPLAPQPRLVRAIAWKINDSTGARVVEQHYAFTAQFVRTYWGSFSANSLVYFDICNSGSFASTDFQNAIFGKGASLLAGWTFKVDSNFAADTARLVFDRLLGSNTFTGAVSVSTPVLESKITGFNQRPFDYLSVSNTDFQAHKLGVVDLLKFLNFIPNPTAPGFGLLAPSIQRATTFELDLFPPRTAGTLQVVGIFGTDPRPDPDSKVTVGGQNCSIKSDGWQPDLILCDLPSGAAGDVVVTVRKHDSNKGRLTKWNGTFNYSIVGAGSLRVSVSYHTVFRADVRLFRAVIHDRPIGPFFDTTGLIVDESSASYACSGSAVQTILDTTTTITWTGAGNVSASRVLPAAAGSFQMIFDGVGARVGIDHGPGPGCDWTQVIVDPFGSVTTSGHWDLSRPDLFGIGGLPIEPNDPSFLAGSWSFQSCFGQAPPTLPGTTPQCQMQWDTITAMFPPDASSAR